MKKYLLALSLVATLVVRGETTTINISEAAGLQKELGADDVLVINVSGNTDQSSVDWSGIIGTGTIKFQGSGVVTLPNSAECRFAETLSLDSSTTLKLGSVWRTTGGGTIQTPFKVRNLSGSAPFNRYSNTARNHLRTEQTKVTEWSGVLENSYSYSGTQYGVYIWVASDGAEPSKDKALIVSGNQTSAQTLRIESTGCVVLKGQWKGTIENNGLLVIAPGVDRSQFTVTGSGRTELQQANEVIVIVPSDLKEMWEEEFKDAYAEIHPGYTCSVVSTADIYEDYPYAATNTNGAPRNPAESIHAFIKNANLKDGNQYFILGGPWINAQDLTSKTIKLATGETLGLNNAVPGIIACKRSQYGECESDLYYACLDSGNTYAWDADGDGEYLEAETIVDDNNRPRHSTIPDVVVTRIPLVTWSEWMHEDGTPLSRRELLKAYVDKLRRGLAADFDGVNSFASYGGNIYEAGNGIHPTLGGAYKELVRRDESEFYTNVKNMFDPARGNDSFWCAETISRRHIKEQIALARPIDAVSALWEESWSSVYTTRDEAREAFYKKNHALRFYYSHGWNTGTSGSGRDDYKSSGCGLTLVDDCAGPCSTGSFMLEKQTDGTYLYDINYAIASVMSPYGGSLATVNNTRAGWFSSDFRDNFNSGSSFELESHMIEGFVCENLTVGQAWREMITRFAKGRETSNMFVWIYSESMLQGDPLVKLPAIEENLNFGIDGVTYTGLPNKTDAVVSMNLDASATEIKSDAKFKVMNGLKTNGQMLSLCTGEGGIGGEGVVFTGEKGMLYLIGDEPFYVAGVKNANVVVEGKGAILDYDNFDATGPGSLVIKTGTEATVRSSTRGCFSKLYDSESGDTMLYVPMNGQLHLATYDAFGDTKGKVGALPGSKLVIDANPLYHNGKDQGESLNAEIKFMHDSSTLDISVAKGGYFTPAEALKGDDRVTYSVDARDGLGGTVTVPNKAKLTLKELPLSKISTLTVESGATLVIPEGKTLDDLLSSGTATLKSGAKIVCGAETTTLSEDKTVDGSKYVTKYYYTAQPVMKNDEQNWTWTGSTKMSLDKDSEPNVTPEGNCEIIFAQGANCPTVPLYIESAVTTKNIHVSDNTSLIIGGESSQKWNLRTGFKVTVDDGSSVTFCGWGNGGQKLTNPIKFADGVVLDGKGLVTIDANDAPLVNCGNISGTATISLPVGVTITSTGTISNDIVVPEGYVLSVVDNGTTKTYSAASELSDSTSWDKGADKISNETIIFVGLTLAQLRADYNLIGVMKGGTWFNDVGGSLQCVAVWKSDTEVQLQCNFNNAWLRYVNLTLSDAVVSGKNVIKAKQSGEGYVAVSNLGSYYSGTSLASTPFYMSELSLEEKVHLAIMTSGQNLSAGTYVDEDGEAYTWAQLQVDKRPVVLSDNYGIRYFGDTTGYDFIVRDKDIYSMMTGSTYNFNGSTITIESGSLNFINKENLRPGTTSSWNPGVMLGDVTIDINESGKLNFIGAILGEKGITISNNKTLTLKGDLSKIDFRNIAFESKSGNTPIGALNLAGGGEIQLVGENTIGSVTIGENAALKLSEGASLVTKTAALNLVSGVGNMVVKSETSDGITRYFLGNAGPTSWEDITEIPTAFEGADLDSFKTWAEKVSGVTFEEGAADTLKLDAYLLNCLNTDNAIEKAEAEFKFTADDLETLMNGGTLETINDVEFNGKLTILGATTLENGGDWAVDKEGAKFFKAVLTLE